MQKHSNSFFLHFVLFLNLEVPCLVGCQIQCMYKLSITYVNNLKSNRGRCGRDRIVVGFTTTFISSAYHH